MVLALVDVAIWSRYMRSSMLDVINQDYIRTARAKGLPERRVLSSMRAQRAAADDHPRRPPAPTLLGGALVTETSSPGPAWGGCSSIRLGYRDYPVVMGILMFSAILVLIGNLLADLLYAVADPRIRLD